MQCNLHFQKENKGIQMHLQHAKNGYYASSHLFWLETLFHIQDFLHELRRLEGIVGCRCEMVWTESLIGAKTERKRERESREPREGEREARRKERGIDREGERR